MSLLDLLVIAVVLLLCAFVPGFTHFSVPMTVTVVLIVERVLKGERL